MTDRVHRALLIANWQFPRDPDRLPDLHGPRWDLPLLRRALTHPVVGLHRSSAVAVLPNRTRGAILRRLEDFLGTASPQDQLTVYYSGHGRLNLEDQLYLCARDTDTDRLVSSAIAARDISQMMADSAARAKIVILDCCYSGSFKSGPTLPGRLGGEGRFVLTSSRRAQLASDGAGPDEPSPFTRFLAEALSGAAEDSDGDGYISIDDVFRHVRDRSRKQAGATPQRSFDQAVGDLAMARSLRSPARRESARFVAPPVGKSPAAAARPGRVVSAADVSAAMTVERRGDLVAACRAYQRLAGAAGDWSTFAAHRLAGLLAGAGDVRGAAAAYRQVVEDRHPDWFPRAACALGDLLAGDGDAAGARQSYEQAIESGHREWAPAAAFRLAVLLAAGGEDRPARSRYCEAMDSGHAEWAPRSAVAMGDLLVRSGALGEARAAYRRAVLSGHHESAAQAELRLRALIAAGPASLSALVALVDDWRQVVEQYPDGEVEQLGSIGSGFDDVRWRATEALRSYGGDEVIAPLVRALDHPRRSVRMSAATVLGARGSAEAIRPLIAMLAEDDHDLPWAAVEALAAIGPPAVDALVESLSAAPPVSHFAVMALALMPASIVPDLAASLTSDKRSVRTGVAEALGRHVPAALAPLLAALHSDRAEVRDAAASGLLMIGGPAADGLIDCLSAPNAATRAAAAEALGKIGVRSAVPALETVLAETDAGCRAAAAGALAEMGTDAMPALARGMRHSREQARTAAMRGAVAMGGVAVPDLIRLAGGPGPANRYARTALAEIATPAALFHLSATGTLGSAASRSAVAEEVDVQRQRHVPLDTEHA